MSPAEIVKVNPTTPEKPLIKRAAEILLQEGLVAFPTETVYGLGANALDEKAILKIFEVKNRPSDNPLIIHISKIADLYLLSNNVVPIVEKVVKKFWPGPLTVVLPRSEIVPDAPVAGLPTVAVRMPNHPVARSLISAADVPIAAPSANLAGRPSPTSATHVVNDIGEKIDMVLDGGEIIYGVESTVVDFTSSPPMVLRPGPITVEELRKEIPELEVHPAVKGDVKTEVLAKSPGMKYRHYAPKAELIVVEGSKEHIREKVQEIVNLRKKEGKSVAVISTVENAPNYRADVVKIVGKRNDLREIAKNFFRILRELDIEGVESAVVEGIKPVGIGLAVMNRLKKAAGGKTIRTD